MNNILTMMGLYTKHLKNYKLGFFAIMILSESIAYAFALKLSRNNSFDAVVASTHFPILISLFIALCAALMIYHKYTLEKSQILLDRITIKRRTQLIALMLYYLLLWCIFWSIQIILLFSSVLVFQLLSTKTIGLYQQAMITFQNTNAIQNLLPFFNPTRWLYNLSIIALITTLTAMTKQKFSITSKYILIIALIAIASVTINANFSAMVLLVCSIFALILIFIIIFQTRSTNDD